MSKDARKAFESVVYNSADPAEHPILVMGNTFQGYNEGNNNCLIDVRIVRADTPPS